MLKNYTRFYHCNQNNNLIFHLKIEIIVINKTMNNIYNYLSKYKNNARKINKIKYYIIHSINFNYKNNNQQK